MTFDSSKLEFNQNLVVEEGLMQRATKRRSQGIHAIWRLCQRQQ